MHLVHALAQCRHCDKSWESRNAMGVAARHHQATGHTVIVEVCYAHFYGKDIDGAKAPRVPPAKRRR